MRMLSCLTSMEKSMEILKKNILVWYDPLIPLIVLYPQIENFNSNTMQKPMFISVLCIKQGCKKTPKIYNKIWINKYLFGSNTIQI